MTDYRQPDFYRFNQDSLKLVKWVLEQVKESKRILDLGAGSGVIGIELARLLCAENLDLVEVQSEYLPFLQQNIREQLPASTQAEIYLSSFGEWQPHKKYDVIVCNPPYFLPKHGEPSRDLKRNIARSFVIDDWAVLLNKILASLSLEGKAFLVIRDDALVLEEIKKFSSLHLKNNKEGKLLFLELSRLNID